MRLKLLVIILVALTMATLITLHLRGINGGWYWQWPWRRLSWRIYPILIAASTPFFLGQWLYAKRRITVAWALAFVTAAAVIVQVAAIIPQPMGLYRIIAVVQNSINTSYFNVAEVLYKQMHLQGASLRDWLEIYPQLMPMMVLHASYKPPGWILYYLLMWEIFRQPDVVAMAGGLLVAVLAAAAVPAVYRLARNFELDEKPAFFAASYFALTPSLLLFLPQGDQAYPALACLLLITWANALHRRAILNSALFGLLLAFGLFFSAVFLMLGLFLAIYTMLYVGDHRGRGLIHAIMCALTALIAIALPYLLLWLITGFDPIETFFTSARRSQAHLVFLKRPWPYHLMFDFYDLVFGTGFISVPLIAFGTWATWKTWTPRHRPWRLVFLGLLQMLVAVLVSLFPGEQARLMLPLMPLLMIPIGIELARWPAMSRNIAYALLLLMLCITAQNMIFLYMGRDKEGVPRGFTVTTPALRSRANPQIPEPPAHVQQGSPSHAPAG
ncbi:MAG TPA: hypothetical protein VF669_21495 [Tepidisphaeraceae bacterium]